MRLAGRAPAGCSLNVFLRCSREGCLLLAQAAEQAADERCHRCERIVRGAFAVPVDSDRPAPELVEAAAVVVVGVALAVVVTPPSAPVTPDSKPVTGASGPLLPPAAP